MELVSQLMESDVFDRGRVVLVAHGGTITALTSALLGIREEDFPMFSGVGNVCWAQLVARPKFHAAEADHSAPAVDGTTVPQVPQDPENWWQDCRWHLEGWNVGTSAAAPMSAPSPDEGGEDAPS